MFVVGIVGRVGAGKSTVARRLAERGAEVVDADLLAHEVLDEPSVRQAIATRFGGDVLDAAGRVNRPVLAARVFGPDRAADLAALEAIVHPGVRRRIEARLDRLRGSDSVVVLDVPLLVQVGLDAICDRLLVITCDDAVRHARLAARGWSAEQIAARDAAWSRGLPRGEPAPGKSDSVDTGDGLSYTLDHVDRLWSDWRRLAAS